MYKITLSNAFLLESGETIEQLTIGFHVYGKLNPQRNNVIWVCHALTANSDVFEWWEGLFGKGKIFNPDEHFIICVNALGSCYGTTGPTTPGINRRPQLEKFPDVTTRDMARVHEELRQVLGIEKINTLIGSSMGGQQALEWSILKPEITENLVLIATNARHSAYGIAFNESQRLAIFTDPTFGNGKINGGHAGLITARSIAMLSYRSYDGYVETQTNPGNYTKTNFLASSYQYYQGQKLASRFDAYTYVTLSKAMDSHNVGRGRESIETALNSIKARTLVIGVGSDGLFPVKEQKFLAKNILNADYAEIESNFGHDGFLIEYDQLELLISDFLFNNFNKNRKTTFKQAITI
ncbi:MAG: homoserine O-acetyltransferase [Crocinitomicaceae bacterium]|nr:homoserine O-acetyltransferase [Crocinitomicaceae bacterium]